MKLSRAIILAAGRGYRIKNILNGIPKGFIRLGEKAIIEESIENLLWVGVKEIVIITGYQDSHYERLKEKFPCITTVKNHKYAESGTMYSLYCARKLANKDFLLLESDLIYERRVLSELVHFPQTNCLLLSGNTQAGDEVYIEGNGDLVSGISKNINSLNNVVGEFVGISKISVPFLNKMIQYYQGKLRLNPKVDYDLDCINEIAKDNDIYFRKIDGMIWAEIDDEPQLLRARKIRDQILEKL